MRQQLISKRLSLFLRGVAILMVIFSHYFEAGYYSVSNPRLAEFVMKLGDPGCWIFFFLSGYALHLKYKDRTTDREFIYKRVLNAYIPYILIAGFIAIYAKELNNPIDFVRLFTGVNYWFMLEIFLLYIVFYLVSKLPVLRIPIVCAFILVMSFWLYLHGYAEFWYTATWGFGVGMIVANVAGVKINESDTSVIKQRSIFSKTWYVFYNAVGFLGSISLYIYMLHMFIYYRIVNNPFFMKLNWGVQDLVSLLITIIISFGLSRLIELFGANCMAINIKK